MVTRVGGDKRLRGLLCARDPTLRISAFHGIAATRLICKANTRLYPWVAPLRILGSDIHLIMEHLLPRVCRRTGDRRLTGQAGVATGSHLVDPRGRSLPACRLLSDFGHEPNSRRAVAVGAQ